MTTTLAIPDEQAGARLDAALAALLPQQSRSQIQRLIKDGKVQVAGVRAEKVKASLPVEAQQEVVVDVPPPAPTAAQPQALPLDIVYEDADSWSSTRRPAWSSTPPPATPTGRWSTPCCTTSTI